MDTLSVGGPSAGREIELSRADLAAFAPADRVDDVGTIATGREGAAVRLEALIALAHPSKEARFVHVASEDESFTANVPLEEALRGGLVLYQWENEALPRRFGGPFRLLFADGEDCSVNVKFLGKIELLEEAGSHTARCAD